MLRVRCGSRRAATRIWGRHVRGKHWINILKSYVVDVRVNMFGALQSQHRTYLMDINYVIRPIRYRTLQASTNPCWDVRIRGDLVEFYRIESKNGWSCDCLLEQRIRLPD